MKLVKHPPGEGELAVVTLVFVGPSMYAQMAITTTFVLKHAAAEVTLVRQ